MKLRSSATSTATVASAEERRRAGIREYHKNYKRNMRAYNPKNRKGPKPKPETIARMSEGTPNSNAARVRNCRAKQKQRGVAQAEPAPHDPSASQGQPVPSNSVAVTKGHQSTYNAAPVQQHDAEGQRPGGSGTQPQTSASKKRPHVEVVSVEHGSAAPSLDDATDRLAQDIRNAGSKKAKWGESEQDRLIRLFHAAHEAHNLVTDLGIRCEKFIEFIVDESFIGREPQDRQELFERLLEMCMQGVTLEVIVCDDPQKMGVLKAYSKRLQVWKVIRELFPDLQDEFKTQPRVLSPFHVLTEDAFKKVNEYLGELKATMLSLPKMLKEAVVWQLLGNVGHRYEQYDEGVHKRVAELIRKNVS